MPSAVSSFFARLTSCFGATGTRPATASAKASFSDRPADPTRSSVPDHRVTDRTATLGSPPRSSVSDQVAETDGEDVDADNAVLDHWKKAPPRISPLLVGGFDLPPTGSVDNTFRLQTGEGTAPGAEASAPPTIPFYKMMTRDFWLGEKGLQDLAAQLRTHEDGKRLIRDLLRGFINWANVGGTRSADVRTAAKNLKSALQNPLPLLAQRKPEFNAFDQAKQRLLLELTMRFNEKVRPEQERQADHAVQNLQAAVQVFEGLNAASNAEI